MQPQTFCMYNYVAWEILAYSEEDTVITVTILIFPPPPVLLIQIHIMVVPADILNQNVREMAF